jgi:glycosyltransferase involved in cell wall biosynthesis
MTYDLCVFTSPAVVSGGLPARLRRRGIARQLLFVLWDFFPIHHTEIGRVPSGPLESVLKRAELACIQDCDVIAVMSPRNAEFLRAYHPGLRSRTVLVPPWSAEAVTPSAAEKRTVFTVVFGGQLTRGRGVETLIDAARLLQAREVDVAIEVYGWGPLRDELALLAEGSDLRLLTFHDPLPREQYRAMLRTVHAGVAITVPGVSVPTFPSKIVDYAQASIAVIACLEETSDVDKLVAGSGAGITCTAGDPLGLADAIADLAKQESRSGAATHMGLRARRLYDSTLSAEAAARTVLSVAAGRTGSLRAEKGMDA